MSSAMFNGGVFSNTIILWLLLFICSAVNCSNKSDYVPENAQSVTEHNSDRSLSVSFDTTDAPLIFIKDQDPYQADDHAFLNSVDWQLRQPLDLSKSEVVTTANSEAEKVEVRFFCNGDELSEESVTTTPVDGKLNISVDTDCSSKFSAELKALGDDIKVEYRYTIDIGFLNELGI